VSVISAIAEKMRDLGHSSEDILAVVLAADEAQDKSERARASNAERQARYRATHNVTSNVTPFPKEASFPPPRDNNSTPSNPPENTPLLAAKKSNGTRIPENWQPSEKTRDYGRRKLGFSESQIDEFIEDLRVWAEAESRNVAVKRDWDSALKGWMRREKRKPKPSARAGPRSTNGVVEMLNELNGVGNERDDEPSVRDITPAAASEPGGFEPPARLFESPRKPSRGEMLDLRPNGSDVRGQAEAYHPAWRTG
jgi:hypothetical protein